MSDATYYGGSEVPNSPNMLNGCPFYNGILLEYEQQDGTSNFIWKPFSDFTYAEENTDFGGKLIVNPLMDANAITCYVFSLNVQQQGWFNHLYYVDVLDNCVRGYVMYSKTEPPNERPIGEYPEVVEVTGSKMLSGCWLIDIPKDL